MLTNGYGFGWIFRHAQNVLLIHLPDLGLFCSLVSYLSGKASIYFDK